MFEHISMFTQLYSHRYTNPIKAYNSVVNKNIHHLKINDHLYHNIIFLCLILILPNVFGSGFNIFI